METERAAASTTRYLLLAFGLFFAVAAVALLAAPRSDAQAASVVINELQPRNGVTILDGDGDSEDWIELRNTTSAPIDLAGWRISDSTASWTIPVSPQSIIPANGYLLIWASDKGDPAEPGFPGPAGELHANFKLGGVTDSVTLINNSFAVEDTVTYDVPFVQDESYGRDAGGSFVVFSPLDVTPGAANGDVTPPTPTPTPTPTALPGSPSIVLNEVMQANTATIQDNGGLGNFEDWIELLNPTCTTIDLTGWSLRDSSASWLFPAGTTLAPNELLFVWASNKGDPDDPDFPGPVGELHTSFRLSATAGEDLFLIDDAGLLVAMVNAGPSIADESYGRTATGSYVTLTGAAISPATLNPGQTPIDCTMPTPTPTVTPIPTATPTPTPTSPVTATPTPTPTSTGGPAVCASALVINEVQTRNAAVLADGDGEFNDWIELYNPGAISVDLSDWRISDAGSTFLLPAGTSIGADGFLLLWASDKGDRTNPSFPGPAGEIHTNFRLSGGEGDQVTLTDSAGCRVDQVAVPPLGTDESFGVTPNGSLGRFFPGYATPLAPNGLQSAPHQSTCYDTLTPIRINRVVARNGGQLLDADGDASDFIELRNTGFEPIDLTAWRLVDESDRWIFPLDTVIRGYDNLIVWASGKGFVLDDAFPGPAGELHANFKLASDGELVVLEDPAGCIADQVDYPELDTDEAYGYDAQDQRAILIPGARIAACAAPGSVQIVAVQSGNESTRSDEDGDFGDWFELRLGDPAGDAVELSGWVIADNDARWVVPRGVTVEPGVDLVVWADRKSRGDASAAPHTNFRLSGDGETLSIGSSNDCLVDSVEFPALDDNQVYRLGADGTFAVEDDPAAEEDDPAAEEPAASGEVAIVGTCLAINELMAKNETTLADGDGEFGDWIELVNLSDETIDLSGYQISDEETPWTIPDGVEIAAGEYLLLWADEGDGGEPGQELHTSFKLASGGEPVTLMTPDGLVAASLSTYPELDDDESFGVDADGNYVVVPAGSSTPGEGPTLSTGCDFEIGSAAAAAGNDEAEVNEADDDGGASDDEATEVNREVEADDDGADSTLATTGTNTRTQSFLAQMLLLIGLVMVSAGHIASRRSRL